MYNPHTDPLFRGLELSELDGIIKCSYVSFPFMLRGILFFNPF